MKSSTLFYICGVFFLTLTHTNNSFSTENLEVEKKSQCFNHYRQLNPDSLFKSFNPNYVDALLKAYNSEKVVMISDLVPIENQGSRGFCHMYSLFEELTREYKIRTSTTSDLSIHYWAYNFWKNRTFETALNPFGDLDIQEGGFYKETFDFIKSVGVMSKKDWSALGGRTDMEIKDRNPLETAQLKKLVVDAKNDLTDIIFFMAPELLPREILNSMKLNLAIPSDRSKYFINLFSNSKEVINFQQWISKKEKEVSLKKTHLTKEDLRLLKDTSKGKVFRGESNIIFDILNKVAYDHQENIEEFFNQIFFDQTETPKNLNMKENILRGKRMFPELEQSTLQFQVDSDNKKGPIEFISVNKSNFLFSTSTESLKEIIKDQIDTNHSVWLAYDHDDYFVDKNSGTMSINQIVSYPINPYIERGVRNNFLIIHGGHAVQIVGYIKGENSDVVAWIIQNSWGTEFGHGGFEIMDWNYFKGYSLGVTIRDRNNQLTRNVNAILMGPLMGPHVPGKKIKKIRFNAKDLVKIID